MTIYDWFGARNGGSHTDPATWYGDMDHFSGYHLANHTLVRTTLAFRMRVVQSHSLPWGFLPNYQIGVYQRINTLSGGGPASIQDYHADWLWYTQVPLTFDYSQTDILTPQANWSGWVDIDSKAQRAIQEDDAEFIVAYGFNPVAGLDDITEVNVGYTARFLTRHE